MIDFLKLEITDLSLIEKIKTNQKFYLHSELEYLSIYDNESINYKKTKQFKNILFTKENNRLYIRFKPHYFLNNNIHNSNDFSAVLCINIIVEFISIFNFTIDELKLIKVINIEFGVNFISSINGVDLIDFVSRHDKKLYNTRSKFEYYKECNFSDERIIKFYSKGIQFPEYCNINTIRFEVKSKRARFINKLEILTLNDLLKFEIYYNLKNNILDEFQRVLILHQSVNTKYLSLDEVAKLKDFLNPYYWSNTLKKSHRNTFNNRKQKYFRLLNKTGFNIHSHLYEKLNEKLNYLLSHNLCAIPHPFKEFSNCAIPYLFKEWKSKNTNSTDISNWIRVENSILQSKDLLIFKNI